MFQRCVFCRAELPANQALERFPIGRRVAYDAGRGRLWAVCMACNRWNLAPLEDRWEALEELEKLTTDHARLLSQTENIALLRAHDIDIVRIGRARLVEEAWWRYGAELQRRRSRYQVVRGVEIAARVAAFALLNFGMLWIGGGNPLNDFLRWRKFGSTAWRGDQLCRRCGAPLHHVSFQRSRHLVLSQHEEQQPLTLQLGCKRCGYNNAEAGFAFRGPEAERLLRRVLAHRHFAGASEQRVKEAVHTIDYAGSPEQLIVQLSRRRYALRDGRKQRDVSIALEIAVNDEIERQWLELELADLESRWREEEELAAIVDGELTPMPLLERLRLKIP